MEINLSPADVSRTEQYYLTHSACSCANCRNFSAAVPVHLPRLTDFLERFGVDVARPEETVGSHYGDLMEYRAWYTVCCSEPVKPCTHYMRDGNAHVRIDVTSRCDAPHKQTGDTYFALAVSGITLPWMIEDPPNRLVSVQNQAKRKGRR